MESTTRGKIYSLAVKLLATDKNVRSKHGIRQKFRETCTFSNGNMNGVYSYIHA